MARSASGRRTSPRPGASVAPGADDPLALLNELARIATQDLELWPMLQRITDTLSARLGAELVSLVRIDRGAGRFVCDAVTSSLPTEVKVGYSRELGSGVVGQVAESGKALLLDDVTTFPGYVETLSGVASELCLPIRHRDEVVALLNLESVRPAAFRGMLPLVSAVAEQVSGAIASARLYEETRRRALFLEVITEVSRAALASGELREVLGRFARFVQERFGLSLAAVVVANEAGTEWEHRAIALRPGLSMPARKRWPVSAGIVGRAIRTGEPQLVFDVAKDPDFFGLDSNINCEYAVPLRFQGRILGAFNVECENRETLEPENLALFRTIAEQIVGSSSLWSIRSCTKRTASSKHSPGATRSPASPIADNSTKFSRPSGAAPAAPVRRSPWCSPTSIISRPTTTPADTRRVTPACRRLRKRSLLWPTGRATWWRATAVRSSR